MAKVKEKVSEEEPIEKQLWKAADKLRKNIDAAEYKHVVLGLIFLKYISDSFEKLHAKLQAGENDYAGADPEDRDEYKAENVFFVPEVARWSYLQSKAKLATIGKHVDDAMESVEKDNPSLKDVLPKVYARGNLDPTSLGGLIDLIANIAFGDAKERSADIFGHVFAFFLGEFALAEGKKGGQFYTPRSVVELLVEMLAPYSGRVLDPCCGSGGMFVQSEKFVGAHQGKVDDISVYGQESNQTTWRLCRMNLAIRGIDSTQVKWNHEGSFLNDSHKDLKADFVIANPPFNDSDWSGDLLRNDGRWKFGTPPAGNANFAWIQHFLYHLSPSGIAGFVLAKGALTSKTSGEGDIRKALVEARLVDCIVNLPAKLFLNTQILASLWFIRRRAGEPSPQPSPKGRGSCQYRRGGEPSPQPSPKERGSCQYRGNFVYEGLLETARQLRIHATSAEALFWELVRNRQFLDLKFRRQHQIGDYVVDFFCSEKNLVVELDGDVHNTAERQKKDHKRDAYLYSLGMDVLRFKNSQLLNGAEIVLSEIASFLNPLPLGEGQVRETVDRNNEILFIDARNEGYLINRRTRALTAEDIKKISDTYHAWRTPKGNYEDIKGFCNSASIERVQALDYVLTPGRYVGLADEEDDFDFTERFTSLKAEFEAQLQEEAVLNKLIVESLARVKL